MPSFETGIPRACAKSGPSGGTIAKSSVAMNRAVPIRNTSLRSDMGGRTGGIARLRPFRWRLHYATLDVTARHAEIICCRLVPSFDGRKVRDLVMRNVVFVTPVPARSMEEVRAAAGLSDVRLLGITQQVPRGGDAEPFAD